MLGQTGPRGIFGPPVRGCPLAVGHSARPQLALHCLAAYSTFLTRGKVELGPAQGWVVASTELSQQLMIIEIFSGFIQLNLIRNLVEVYNKSLLPFRNAFNLPDNLGRWIKRFLVTSVQNCFYKIAISKFIKETKMLRNLLGPFINYVTQFWHFWWLPPPPQVTLLFSVSNTFWYFL